MQSGLGKTDKWILIFETKDPVKNPLMGWESSSDTYSELKLDNLMAPLDQKFRSIVAQEQELNRSGC